MMIGATILDSFKPEAFFVPLVDAYLSEHPDIHVRIESDAAQEIRRMLIGNEVDVIFSIYYDFEEK